MGLKQMFTGEQSLPQLRKALLRAETKDLPGLQGLERDAETAHEVGLEDAPDGDALRALGEKRDDAKLAVRKQTAHIKALKDEIAKLENREKAEKERAILDSIFGIELGIVSALTTANALIFEDMQKRQQLQEIGCAARCASLPTIPTHTYELGSQYGGNPVSPRHEALERFGYQITLLKKSLERAS